MLNSDVEALRRAAGILWDSGIYKVSHNTSWGKLGVGTRDIIVEALHHAIAEYQRVGGGTLQPAPGASWPAPSAPPPPPPMAAPVVAAPPSSPPTHAPRSAASHAAEAIVSLAKLILDSEVRRNGGT